MKGNEDLFGIELAKIGSGQRNAFDAGAALALETTRHEFVRRQLSINCDRIDPAIKGAPGTAAHRRSNPNGGVINHRLILHRTAQIPSAFRRHAVDPATHRLRLSKFIGDRNMMPFRLHLERQGRRPSRPMIVARFRSGCKEETQFRRPTTGSETQRPILIFPIKTRIMSSALTDEIESGRIFHRRGFYPGLDRNGVSIGEIEATLLAFVRNNDFRSGPVKAQRFVGFGKTGEFRRTRTFIAQIKIPTRHRRHFVGSDDTGRKREQTHEDRRKGFHPNAKVGSAQY